jgi:hypothetical protein
MSIILRKSDGLQDIIEMVIDRETNWYYYECQDCAEEYKSDIPYKKLFCLTCEKVMHRNCHQVEAW